jgi:hypothetical protein
VFNWYKTSAAVLSFISMPMAMTPALPFMRWTDMATHVCIMSIINHSAMSTLI